MLLWLLMAAAIALPVIVSIQLDPIDYEEDVFFPPSPADGRAPIGERFEDGLQPASITFQWAAGDELVWSGESGVVTDLSTFEQIRDGVPVLWLNGEAIVAQVTGRPLYRDLAKGDSGPDVSWLDEMFVSVGLAQQSTLDSRQRLSAVSTRAIQTWQRLTAAPAVDGVFKVASTVYLGNSDVTQLEWEVEVGDRIQSGDTVARESETLLGVTIELTGDERRHGLVRRTPVAIEFDETTIPAKSITLADDEVARFADAVEIGTESVVANIRRTSPLHFGTVPSTSLFTGDSVLCLLVWSNGSKRAVTVTVASEASTEPGISYVQPELIGDEVVLRPTVPDGGLSTCS